MPLNDVDLERLEKKYFLEIYNTLSTHKNELKDRFNSRLNILGGTIGISYKVNEVDAGAERIILAMLCKYKSWNVNSSPISSDALFELHDSLINIDSKTYRYKQREKNKVNLRRNQTNYGDNTYFRSQSGIRFTWKPSLRKYYTHTVYGEIPCLTYVVKFIYDDNNQSLVESQLIGIPNGQLVNTYGRNVLNRGKARLVPGKPVPDIRFKISTFSNPQLTSGWTRKEIIYP